MRRIHFLGVSATVVACLCASGCWKKTKDTTKSIVTAPGRWWSGRKDRKEQERLKDLREGNSEGVQTAITPERDDLPSGDMRRGVEVIRNARSAGDYQRALSIFDDILEIRPEDDEAWRYKADCHYNLLQLQEAVDAYSRARALNRYNYLALRGWGFAELNMGHQLWAADDQSASYQHYRKALDLLNDALQVQPRDSETNLGKAMATEGAARYLYNRALVLQKQNDSEGAAIMRDKCIELCSAGVEAAKFRLSIRIDDRHARAIVGTLFMRIGLMQHAFGDTSAAVRNMRNAKETWESILREIDSNDQQARSAAERCDRFLERWS